MGSVGSDRRERTRSGSCNIRARRGSKAIGKKPLGPIVLRTRRRIASEVGTLVEVNTLVRKGSTSHDRNPGRQGQNGIDRPSAHDRICPTVTGIERPAMPYGQVIQDEPTERLTYILSVHGALEIQVMPILISGVRKDIRIGSVTAVADGFCPGEGGLGGEMSTQPLLCFDDQRVVIRIEQWQGVQVYATTRRTRSKLGKGRDCLPKRNGRALVEGRRRIGDGIDEWISNTGTELSIVLADLLQRQLVERRP